MSASTYAAGTESSPAHSVDLPTPVLSVSPVVLPVPGRPVDLEVRVSAPVTGSELPVVLLSHGHGRSNNLSSLNGYAPLANYWAAHGFVVVQPTHLSSSTLRLDPGHRRRQGRLRPPDGPGPAVAYRSVRPRPRPQVPAHPLRG